VTEYEDQVVDEDIVQSLNRTADREQRFEPASLPQVLLCLGCSSLVPEDRRGLHLGWHLSLDDLLHSHDEDEELD
jgi:hypothetical protein